ncbi:MAG TPA: VOC family protein [Polyangiaceae bacterium]|nr:VOC family protein [Polyangiaceae bacterium]
MLRLDSPFVNGDARGMGTRAIAFLATRNADAARRFYEGTLGLELREETDFAIVFDAFGTMLRIQKTPDVKVAPYTAFGLEVDDIAQSLATLIEKGVEPRIYPGLEQDSQGIWTAPSGARVAWFTDPDGHTVSLSQF